MKRLLIDMDGVLADIYEQFMSYEYKDTGLKQSLQDITGKPEHEAFKNHIFMSTPKISFILLCR